MIGSSAVELLWHRPGRSRGSRLVLRNGPALCADPGRPHFQSSDFETWSPTAESPEPPQTIAAGAARLPEPGSRVVTDALASSRIYALGHQICSAPRRWTVLAEPHCIPLRYGGGTRAAQSRDLAYGPRPHRGGQRITASGDRWMAGSPGAGLNRSPAEYIGAAHSFERLPALPERGGA
jgi:hypothetical protein